MKILSVAIPAYNSEKYLSNCVDSLLLGGEDMEILIIDDGSKDNTAKIADEYQAKYPSIVKAIHQPNAGHGGAVNTGMAHASGLYFKVVDSDDWVKEDSLIRILAKLKELMKDGHMIDMMVSNFVYEKEGQKKKKVMQYRRYLPKEQVFTWKDVRRFRTGKYLLMHSVIYRTKLLRDCGLTLPKHTFYVDNIYVFEPLPYVKTMYYIDTNFYRYYIGRDDQSVSEKNMIARIDQQLRVTKIMIDYMAGHTYEYRKLDSYMRNYMDIMMTVSTIFLIKANTPEALDKKRDLWAYLKEKDFGLYMQMRMSFLGAQTHLPGRAGRKITLLEYKMAQKVFGFN